MTTDVKFPKISVQLVGQDGNAFSILGRVKKAMERGGVPKEDREAFLTEATSGDYNNLLRTVMEWVDVDDEQAEEDWEEYDD